MLLSKKLSAVLLAALLVAGLLVGFGGGDQAVAKEPRATIGKIMIPAAAFIPTRDYFHYSNNGYYLRATGATSHFTAPLSFPVPEVNIRRLLLIAYDNDNTATGKVCVNLYRSEPLRASELDAGGACTADSPDTPQRVAVTALSPRKMYTLNHGPYLWVSINPGTLLFGVQVIYSY